MSRVTYLACTYYDLTHYDLLHPNHLNLNIPQGIWGNFSTLEDAVEYIKKIRRRKTDTLWGAWDIYQEDWELVDKNKSWNFNKIVRHFPPRANHDFYGKVINKIVIANVEMSS